MNLRREFAEYVAANVCSMLGLSVYILADTYFISAGMGADGLTALNLALPLYNFISGVGLMLGVGGAARFILSRTRGDRERSDGSFTAAAGAGIFFAALFCLAGALGAGRLAALLGAEGRIFEMTRIYLRMLLLFSPAFILNQILSMFVKNDGAPRLAMAGMLAGSLFNIVFDYLFIFVFRMGMFGAALATVFSPILGVGILSAHFRKRNNAFSLRPGLFRAREVGKVASLGVSSLIAELSAGLVMIQFNMIILKLAGNVGVAAYGVIANILIVVTAVYNGIAQGAQPLFGRLFAEGRPGGLRKVRSMALWVTAGFSLLFYILTLGFPAELTAIFNREGNEELRRLALHGFRLYFSGCFFLGANLLSVMYFVSTGREKSAQLLSLLRGFVLIVPGLFLLSRLLGMDGVWLAMPATEALVFGLSLILRGKE